MLLNFVATLTVQLQNGFVSFQRAFCTSLFLAKKKNFKLKVHEFAHVSTVLFISCCIIEHKIARGYLGSISLRTVCANTPVFSRRTSIVANLRWRRWKHALMRRPVFWIPCATNTHTIQTASFSILCLRQRTK